MRRTLVIIALIAMGIVITGCGSDNNTFTAPTVTNLAVPKVVAPPGQKDPAGTVVLTSNTQNTQVNMRIVILLPTNPSTGYRWELASYPKDKLVYKGVQTPPTRNQKGKPLVGAGTTAIYTFITAAKGTAKIVFKQIAPSGKAGKTKTYTVNIA